MMCLLKGQLFHPNSFQMKHFRMYQHKIYFCYPSKSQSRCHQIDSECVNELFAVSVTLNLHLHGLIYDRSVLPWQDQPSIFKPFLIVFHLIPCFQYQNHQYNITLAFFRRSMYLIIPIGQPLSYLTESPLLGYAMLMVGSGIRPTVTRPTYGGYEAPITLTGVYHHRSSTALPKGVK